MKKLLVALALVSAASGASATTVNAGYLYVDNAVATPLAMPWGPVSGVSMPVGAIGYEGALKSVATGTFTATYLGQAAGFANLYLGQGTELAGAGRALGWPNVGFTPVVGVGLTQTINVAANTVIDFAFATDNNNDGIVDAGTVQANGAANIAGSQSKGILFFLNTFGLKDAEGKLFDFLVGYDDINSDNDFDDYVIGVTAVPVPAALPLLASALAAFGIARRKSKQA
jgi:hypothetical protein